MTTDPRPALSNGTRLRAMASSIRHATSGRASVDAPSILIHRVCADPCNNFSGSGNSLPRLKYSLTPSASARIARTPSYPCSLGEKLMAKKSRYSYTTSWAVCRRFRSDRRIAPMSRRCAGANLSISVRTWTSADRRAAADWVLPGISTSTRTGRRPDTSFFTLMTVPWDRFFPTETARDIEVAGMNEPHETADPRGLIAIQRLSENDVGLRHP